MKDRGAKGLFFDVLLVGEQTGRGDGWQVVEGRWALVAQGSDGGEMVEDFYLSSEKVVVFLLSDGEEGSEKVAWRGSVDRSKRDGRKRRSGRKGNLEGSSRGGDVVLVVIFNTGPGVNGCRRRRESGHLNNELAPVLGDCSNVANSLLCKAVRGDVGLELEVT
jgi:hypothetical protein